MGEEDELQVDPEVQDGSEWHPPQAAGYAQESWDHWDQAPHADLPQGLHPYAAVAAPPPPFY